MSIPKSIKRWTAGLLAFAVAVNGTVFPPAAAAGLGGKTALRVSESGFSPNPRPADALYKEQDDVQLPDDDEIVRVSILLEDDSAMDAGYDISTIAVDEDAAAYREELEEKQHELESVIEEEVLGGEELDVVWNLTLAANLISANVEFGLIEQIEALDGVKQVFIEEQFLPALYKKNALDPNMAVSTEMIGSGVAWNEDYTGAGTLIAILDTGVDTDHQSFDGGAFMHSLEQLGYDGDILTFADYEDKLSQLNIVKRTNKTALDIADAENLYVSEKVPFAFNYATNKPEDFFLVGHMDGTSEHGSHVAGIAAANAYIPASNGGYITAIDSVYVQGVAPDAQILDFKVFGGETATSSDTVAAIEDALVMGADVINMSLGSSVGFTLPSASNPYAAIYGKLANNDSGTVVSISAGNEGYWAENTAWGDLYSDDVNFQMLGSPSALTESLSVASINNAGAIGAYVKVGDKSIIYAESDYSNEALAKALGGKELDYVIINGVGTADDFAKVDVKDKVAICKRGTISFYQKAEAAVEAGAAAVIIVNNEAGVINMDLSDYKYTKPVVSITLADGNILWDNANIDVADGLTYGTGKLTVGSGTGVSYNNDRVMSDFSSWGSTGSLELKPEITAPGGNIYSVFGKTNEGGSVKGGTDQYENMSGTSMAAPQITGMSALVAQYVKENGLADGSDVRALVQSLLMSTAVPVMDSTYADYGLVTYYPVIQQGAGLANVGNAVTSGAYIMMESDATASYADGKVKAEIGEVGETFSYSFTVTNISEKAITYALDTDLFTQEVDTYYAVLSHYTIDIEGAEVTYTVNGSEVTEITVAAGESVTVTVNAELDPDEFADYANGAYIEGYTFLTPDSTDEGAQEVTHSIPIYGFYGNWSDPTMYDDGLFYNDYAYDYDYIQAWLAYYASNPNADVDQDGAVTLIDYFLLYSTAYYTNGYSYTGLIYTDHNDGENYWYVVNPYGYHLEEDGPQWDRAAINGEDILSNFSYTQIRPGYMGIYLESEDYGFYTGTSLSQSQGVYYDSSRGWQNTSSKAGIGVALTDDIGFEDGDEVEISLVIIPEYYVMKYLAENPGLTVSDLDDDFVYNIKDQLGDGAFLTYALTVDNEAPEVISAEKNADGDLEITLSDNQYIGYVGVFSRSGAIFYDEGIPEDQTQGGTSTITFSAEDLEDAGKYVLVQAVDYAGNVTNMEVELDPEYEAANVGDMFGYSDDSYYTDNVWYKLDPETVNIPDDGYEAIDVAPEAVIAATYVDEYIFQATADGSLYVAPQDDLGYFDEKVAVLPFTAVDMAFNYADSQLYAIDEDGGVWSINPLTGDSELKYYMRGDSYAEYDVDQDGVTDDLDAQAILDYLAGNVSEDEIDLSVADVDGDGDVDSYDAHLLLLYLKGSYTVQGLTIDADGTFYGAGYDENYYTKLFKWTAESEINEYDAVVIDEAFDLYSEDGFEINDDDTVSAGVLAYDYNNDLIYMAVDASPWAGSSAWKYDYLIAIDVTGQTYGAANEDGAALYGKFVGLYVVPDEDGLLEDDLFGDSDITGITVSKDELTLMIGGTAQVEALVSPWTAEDRSVIWSSADPSVARVNSRGFITGVSEGTTTITAAAAANPEVTAEVKVTVVPLPDVMLNASLQYDSINLVSFNTNNTESYTKISPDLDVEVIGGTLTFGDKLIMNSYDYGIYAVDPADFEVAELVEPGSFYFSDAAPAYYGALSMYDPNSIVCTWNSYIYVLDSELYGYELPISYFSLPANVAAIDFMGATSGIDMYYAVLENGDVYALLFLYSDDGLEQVAGVPMGSTGLDLTGVSSHGNPYYSASLLYDWDYADENDYELERLYLVYYTGDDCSYLDVIDIDWTGEDAAVTVLAEAAFAYEVWPVASLYQFDASAYSLGIDHTHNVLSNYSFNNTESTFEASSQIAQNTLSSAPAIEKSATAVRSAEDNSAAVMAAKETAPLALALNSGARAAAETEEGGDDAKIYVDEDDVVIDTENNLVTIKVKVENNKVTNALFQLEYDADVLEFVETEAKNVEYYSDNGDEAGVVTFDFADAFEIYDEDSDDYVYIAEFTFGYEYTGERIDTTFSIERIETNDYDGASVTDVSDVPIVIPATFEVDVSGLEHGHSPDAPATATEGEDLSFTITPDTGYTLPESITITVGGEVLSSDAYSYDPATGKVTIYGDYVTGDISISAVFPAAPTEPDEPDRPAKPIEPAEPTEPDKPAEPEDPSDVIDPDKPGDPTDVIDPDKPGETDKPDNTDKPGNTDKPNEPDVVPGDSNGSANGNGSTDNNPFTGTTADDVAVFMAVSALAIGAVTFFIKRKGK